MNYGSFKLFFVFCTTNDLLNLISFTEFFFLFNFRAFLFSDFFFLFESSLISSSSIGVTQREQSIDETNVYTAERDNKSFSNVTLILRSLINSIDDGYMSFIERNRDFLHNCHHHATHLSSSSSHLFSESCNKCVTHHRS